MEEIQRITMEDVKWYPKLENGLVIKKSFPYISNVWRSLGTEEAYYYGIAADIGMDAMLIQKKHVQSLIY